MFYRWILFVLSRLSQINKCKKNDWSLRFVIDFVNCVRTVSVLNGFGCFRRCCCWCCRRCRRRRRRCFGWFLSADHHGRYCRRYGYIWPGCCHHRWNNFTVTTTESGWTTLSNRKRSWTVVKENRWGLDLAYHSHLK